jgi:hypothetical protein
MEQENDAQRPLHSLIPLEDFKALLGIDDRENALSRYCLVTATYTIEHYCKQRLLRKKHTDYLGGLPGDRIALYGDAHHGLHDKQRRKVCSRIDNKE